MHRQVIYSAKNKKKINKKEEFGLRITTTLVTDNSEELTFSSQIC